jgi:hypothetical protein
MSLNDLIQAAVFFSLHSAVSGRQLYIYAVRDKFTRILAVRGWLRDSHAGREMGVLQNTSTHVGHAFSPPRGEISRASSATTQCAITRAPFLRFISQSSQLELGPRVLPEVSFGTSRRNAFRYGADDAKSVDTNQVYAALLSPFV